jgi:ribosomal protein L20
VAGTSRERKRWLEGGRGTTGEVVRSITQMDIHEVWLAGEARRASKGEFRR